MAMSRTYGKLEIPMIGEDEPVFILRGQDILAQAGIEMYQLLAEAHGYQVSEALMGEISCFQQWQGERRLPSWPAQGKPEGTHRVAVASRRH